MTQVIPSIPADQRLEIRAPEGYSIIELNLSYTDSGTGGPLGGTQMRPQKDSDRVRHTMSLTNGAYELKIAAQLATETPADRLFFIQEQREVELNGSSQVIYLKSPK